MSDNKKWIDKKFDFDFPITKYMEFILSLRQTATILSETTQSIPKKLLIRKDGEKWSIQEHVGHYYSVDTLFIGRLDDYLNNLHTLRAADMSGKSTYDEDYNSLDLKTILEDFRNQRENYLTQLEKLQPDDFGKTSLHLRLNVPMRLVDMLNFQVEHDKYHIIKIEELKTRWAGGNNSK